MTVMETNASSSHVYNQLAFSGISACHYSTLTFTVCMSVVGERGGGGGAEGGGAGGCLVLGGRGHIIRFSRVST